MDASGASIAAATAAGEVQRKREVIRLEDATKEQGSRSDVGKQTDAQTQLSLCSTRLPLLTDATDYQERIPDMGGVPCRCFGGLGFWRVVVGPWMRLGC